MLCNLGSLAIGLPKLRSLRVARLAVGEQQHGMVVGRDYWIVTQRTHWSLTSLRVQTPLHIHRQCTRLHSRSHGRATKALSGRATGIERLANKAVLSALSALKHHGRTTSLRLDKPEYGVEICEIDAFPAS